MDARPRPGATNGSNYFKTSVIFTLVAGVGQCELSHCWISARTQVLAARQVLAASQKQNQDPRNPRSSQRKNVLVLIRVISYHSAGTTFTDTLLFQFQFVQKSRPL